MTRGAPVEIDAPHPVLGTRWRRMLVVVVGIGLVAASVLFTLVMDPPVDLNPQGDAVIVHAGGRGERMETALELMEGGAAPTLVAMYLGTELYPDPAGLCGQEAPYAVVCPAPEPVTTIGEAHAIGDLVAVHGWDEIVIVTTDYHVRRAKLLDDKCTDATIDAVAAGHRLGMVAHAERVGHEMLGMLQALIYRC